MTGEVYSKGVVDELLGGVIRVQVLTLRLQLEQQITDGIKTREQVMTFLEDYHATCKTTVEDIVFKVLADAIREERKPTFEVIEGGLSED